MSEGDIQGSALAPPPVAANKEAVEVLRVWAMPGEAQQFSVQPCWRDPGAWGLLLVDVARHVSQAYAQRGMNKEEALQRIKELFDAEWASPTSPTDEV